MMLRVIPVSCMITSAARIESGMLTAATIVARMLNRNRKIVRIAKRAPRPPSLTRPSRDSLMNVDRSDDDRRSSRCPAYCSPSSSSLAVTASATCDGVGVRGLRDRQRERRLAVGAGVAGRRDAGDLDRADVADRDRGGRGGDGSRGCGRATDAPGRTRRAAARRGRRGGPATRRGRTAGRRCPATRRCRRRPRQLHADDHVLDLVDALDAADRGHRDLRAVGRDLAGREGQVVGREDARDLAEA